MITEISKLLFFSLQHTITQIPLSPHGYFFNFLQNQTQTLKMSFWFFEKQGPTIDSIYGLLLLSRALQDNIDTNILSVYFLFCNIITARYIWLSPINKTFTFLVPHYNYTYPPCNWKIQVTLKNFVCSE